MRALLPPFPDVRVARRTPVRDVCGVTLSTKCNPLTGRRNLGQRKRPRYVISSDSRRRLATRDGEGSQESAISRFSLAANPLNPRAERKPEVFYGLRLLPDRRAVVVSVEKVAEALNCCRERWYFFRRRSSTSEEQLRSVQRRDYLSGYRTRVCARSRRRVASLTIVSNGDVQIVVELVRKQRTPRE